MSRGRFGPRPEVLAPGGSLEAIEVAVAHGADAVYAGVGALNARVRAANLDVSQLPGIAEFCHAGGTRLYVTLNVPLRAADLPEAARVLAACEAAGVDAVIARDPALMRVARDRFPALQVHASTQAGVHTVETARRVAEAGCSRAILARECSRDDIARIREALPGLELEVFVFGAQCFGVSGLCLMGEATSGRSGNYGACSQACRLPWSDEAGRPAGHPFSMRDLDLVGEVPELVRLGVASLKIEGRLKSPAWVGCVVHWLRTALDRPVPGLSPGEAEAFRRDVSALYSRPRSAGFFHGVTDWSEAVDGDAPGHRGCEASEVRVRQTPEGPVLRFRTPVDLNVRDGLLLALDAPDLPAGRDFVPVGIRELYDEQRRPCVRVSAGRVVEVPVEVRRQVLGVAVHSSDGVRVRYGRVDRRAPGAVAEGRPPAPRFLRVEVSADRVRAAMRRGRVQGEFEAAVASQPARGAGLTGEVLGKHFGDAEFRADPGLYVNPSDFKRARRELEAAFEAFAAARLEARAGEAEAALRADPRPEPVDDATLLARGPAAVSRVTGMAPGVYVSPHGTRFRVVPTATGTVIRHEGGGRADGGPIDGPDPSR